MYRDTFGWYDLWEVAAAAAAAFECKRQNKIKMMLPLPTDNFTKEVHGDVLNIGRSNNKEKR